MLSMCSALLRSPVHFPLRPCRALPVLYLVRYRVSSFPSDLWLLPQSTPCDTLSSAWIKFPSQLSWACSNLCCLFTIFYLTLPFQSNYVDMLSVNSQPFQQWPFMTHCLCGGCQWLSFEAHNYREMKCLKHLSSCRFANANLVTNASHFIYLDNWRKWSSFYKMFQFFELHVLNAEVTQFQWARSCRLCSALGFCEPCWDFIFQWTNPWTCQKRFSEIVTTVLSFFVFVSGVCVSCFWGKYMS